MSMNLGSANLRYVNTSTPQLLHHNGSKRSIAASDDYYSLSDDTQSASSGAGGSGAGDDRATVVRYRTPPSHAGSAPHLPYHPTGPYAHGAPPPAARSRTALRDRAASPLPTHEEAPASAAAAAANDDDEDNDDHYDDGGDLEKEGPVPDTTDSEAEPEDASRAGTGSSEYPEQSPASPHPRDAEKTLAPGPDRPTGAQQQPQPQQQRIPRKPLTAAQMRNWRQSGSHGPAGAGASGSPPTPGNDDTPYIQFAIEQLTRDEEVFGPSRAGAESPDDVSPVSSGHRAGAAAAAPARTAGPIRHVGGDADLLHKEITPAPCPPPPPPPIAAPAAAVLPPSRAGREYSVSPLSEEHEEDLRQFLVPADPPPDAFRYPPLDFIPRPLGLPALGLLALLCTALLVLLVYASARAGRRDGLWAYDGLGTPRAFVFQFLPALLAVLVLLGLHHVQAAIQRALPFALLARADRRATAAVFSAVPLYVTNYLAPDLRPFRHGEPLLGLCALVFWLANFTVPLASCLFQTRLYAAAPDASGGDGGASWIWTAVQPITFILIFLYLILIFALAAVHLRFRRHPTGLKWDPVALADLFVLLRRSPLASAPAAADARGLPAILPAEKQRLDAVRPASIGYWESPSHPGTFVHGIGTSVGAHAPPRRHIEKGRTVSSDLESQQPDAAGPLPQASTFESWHSHNNHSARRRTQPPFLRDALVLLYPVVALVLLVAFCAAAYARDALTVGFDPRVPAGDAASASAFASFAPADFLYAFLPTLLATLLPLLWTPCDTAFRYLQPLAALAAPGGASAARSLLTAYPAQPPGLVTVRALLARHWRVALLSLLTLVAWALPVAAAGLFSARFVPARNAVLVRADPAALHALTALLAVHALGWAALWPGPKRRALPPGVDLRCLAGVASLAGGELRGGAEAGLWREPRGRLDLVTRLVGSGRWGLVDGRVVRA